MKSKFYIFIAILTFCISFSQTKPEDSLVKCHGILNDFLLNTVQNAYQSRINKPQEPPQVFGCGTAAMMYAEELDCNTAKYILEKYSFILEEIKKLKQDYPNYSYLNAFWIQKTNESDNTFSINEEDKEKLEKWKSQRNHARFSVVIISDKIDDNSKEKLQLEIFLPKDVIIKQYELSYEKRWNYKEL